MDQETFQQLIDSAIEGLEKKPMSISERAGKLKTLIFEYEADFARDKKTIEALRSLKKESLIVDLEKILSKDSRKMVNVLSFAENHENKTGVKNSFGDLSDWKSSRVYE
jgi:Secreted/periplasmic Zn-dependent peptidases, insulinase-like